MASVVDGCSDDAVFDTKRGDRESQGVLKGSVVACTTYLVREGPAE